jgi:hypothetical protein
MLVQDFMNAVPMNSSSLAGIYLGGKIDRISQVKWEQKTPSSYPPSSPLYGLGGGWATAEEAAASSRLRALCENARWQISPDGSLRFETAAGVIAGKIVINEDFALASAAYQKRNVFDMTTFSVDAMLLCTKPGQLQASISISLLSDQERLTGEFEQLLIIR